MAALRPCFTKLLAPRFLELTPTSLKSEVDVSGVKCDEDHFHTVGLPDAAVRESRDRVRAALRNCGYDIPLTHITINLAPADIKKEGSGFDLPMALGILGAYGGLNKKELSDCLFVGELSLDGGIRSVRGALPIAIEARGRKISRIVVPEVNAKEAAMVAGISVYPVKSFIDVVHFVNNGNGILPVAIDQQAPIGRVATVSFRFQGCSWPADRQARARSRLRRWSQHSNDRSTRLWQDHAGQTHSHDPASIYF